MNVVILANVITFYLKMIVGYITIWTHWMWMHSLFKYKFQFLVVIQFTQMWLCKDISNETTICCLPAYVHVTIVLWRRFFRIVYKIVQLLYLYCLKNESLKKKQYYVRYGIINIIWTKTYILNPRNDNNIVYRI